MRKALVKDSFVENVIEIEEDANWEIPIGCILVDAKTEGSPDDTWDGEKFIRPVLPPQEEPFDIIKEIADLKAEIALLKAIKL